MARCLNLTRAGEYAIAALARLAFESDGLDAKTLSIQALSESQNIPKTFLAKILAQCVRAGIIRSKKGQEGGVALIKPAHQISLLSIIEACEGAYWREFCVFYATRRCDGPKCEIYCPLREKEEVVRNELNRVTLADMALSLQRHPLFQGGSWRGGIPWT